MTGTVDYLGNQGASNRHLALFERLAHERWDDDTGYRLRPVEWCADKPHHHLHAMQREIIESVRDNRYTAVHSAHEIGKSLVAADAIAWWVDSHPIGETFVVSTAPTAAQVASILWREVGRIHDKAELPGRINRAGYPQWYVGNLLVGYGRKPADYDESAFQGIHERYVLVVVDEACGVDKHLFDSIRSIVANEHSRVLAIGNPDDPGSYFYEICQAGSIWNVIHLDALKTPNFTEAVVVGDDPTNPRYPLTAALMEVEGVPYSTEVIPPMLGEMLVSPLYVEESLVDWCGVPLNAAATMDRESLLRLVKNRAHDSPIFTSKVRGLFPSSTRTGVIPLGWVEAAMRRWQEWHDAGEPMDWIKNPTSKVLGIDVAYGGQDETVFAERYGECVKALHRFRNADTEETVKSAHPFLLETGMVAVVDVIGIGAGVYDQIRKRRLLPSTNPEHVIARVIPFNAAARSDRTDFIGEFSFRNDRAAAWWNMRQLLDPSRGSRIMLPADDRLKAELTTVKYIHHAGAIITIESKDEIRKRLGRSTDSADSVIQCFWPEGLGPKEHDDKDTYAYAANQRRRRNDPDVFSYEGAEGLTMTDLRIPSGRLGGRQTWEDIAEEVQSW